jgi:hypothetical protein
MQKSGRQRDGIEAHVRKDVSDFEKVCKVGVARSAQLIAMPLCRNLVRAPDHPGIFRGAILAQLGEQFVQASVQLALGAVAMEMER